MQAEVSLPCEIWGFDDGIKITVFWAMKPYSLVDKYPVAFETGFFNEPK
jgi:hypothetical protein